VKEKDGYQQALIYAEELSSLYQQEKDRANDLEAAKENLEEAISRMREAERIRDQFIQNCSHELRTPLSPILGWGNLLKSGKVTPDALPGVGETIVRQAKRLMTVVDSLLMVADINRESPRTIDQGPIEVEALFHETAERLDLDPPPEIDVEDEARWIVGNATYLSVVITNLLDNAVKFSPEGLRPQLRARRDDDVVEIQVIDRGPGIPLEQKERIRGAFVQGDGSTTRVHGGLGLGLYVCEQVVEGNGGELILSDTPGGGTTAIVRMPQRRQIDQAAVESRAAEG